MMGVQQLCHNILPIYCQTVFHGGVDTVVSFLLYFYPHIHCHKSQTLLEN